MNNSKSDVPKIPQVITYRLKKGDLAYRNRMNRLSANARKLVYMFEGGSEPNDVIDWLAEQYTTNSSSQPSAKALHAAEVEYSHLIAEVAQVFSV